MLGFDRGLALCLGREICLLIWLSAGLEGVLWLDEMVLNARIVLWWAGELVCQLSLGRRNRGSICAEFNPAFALFPIL
jgi:hypothetical protein